MARRKSKFLSKLLVFVALVGGLYYTAVRNRIIDPIDLSNLPIQIPALQSGSQTEPSTTVPTSTSGTIKLASWNVRVLTDNSRDDGEVRRIADIIRNFDIVAIQEARDTRVLDRIKAQLPGYDYVASQPVGRGQREIYAFFWRTSSVRHIGRAHTVDDPQDVFIREPYAGTFSAGEFDFTLCTIHLLFGDSQADRRRELVYMDEVVRSVQSANGDEQDVILLGDFNFPPDDRGWQLNGWTAVFQPPTKTTVGDVSLYDNIWFHPSNTGAEYTGTHGVIRFDVDDYPGDVRRARREVSDHRPVWVIFRTTSDDDADNYGNLDRSEVRRSGGVTFHTRFRAVDPLL